MKRVIDFSAAFLSLLVLASPLGMIALAIWLSDRGSPLYLGPRIGKDGKPFRMAKFRSMQAGAWKSGVNSTAADDARITRIGGFLRRLKLDELPQLFNVLGGTMSLVGPRPQVPSEVILYTREERGLLAVCPGVTDLASIVFADEAEILAGSADPDLLYNQIIRPWKSRLGLGYIAHASAALDFRILALTLLSAWSRRRALDSIARLLESWNADPALVRAALRKSPLEAWPPPGSEQIAASDARAVSRGA